MGHNIIYTDGTIFSYFAIPLVSHYPNIKSPVLEYCWYNFAFYGRKLKNDGWRYTAIL